MRHKRLFLVAYACSGVAGLIYEVGWTRLITLYMGQSTAAASTVVASFMGGLAIGSYAGGRIAQQVSSLQSLYCYIVLEFVVGAMALIMPHELSALTPILTVAYRDGAGNIFSLVRFILCLGTIAIPSAMLGATFQLAVRSYITSNHDARHASSVLYSANTCGAALGSLAAGFFLVPLLGVRATTLIGVIGSCIAGLIALIISRSFSYMPASGAPICLSACRNGTPSESGAAAWLAIFAVGVSGCAGLLIEIVWTRVLSLVVGPTIYVFSATLAAFISGSAIGATLGSWVAARTRRPAFWLAIVFALSAIAVNLASSLAVSYLPLLTMSQINQSAEAFSQHLPWHAAVAAAMMIPAAAAIGAVFPLALHMINGSRLSVTRGASVVYLVNVLAAVAGALIAGFIVMNWLGLQGAVRAGSALLISGCLVVATFGRRPFTFRAFPFVLASVAVAILAWAPTWDRKLLAGGPYRYSPGFDSGLDVASVLKAGRLVYYRDGAAATVSVRQLTGSLSLAIDGKIDASNSGDMLTQKTLAHLPLLLHPAAHDVCIIGLGSGVTLAAALVHPITRADVVEISPEVVEASRYFSADNNSALDDPRTHLIVGDGRSHLLLSSRQYDVIISEPSNPWMAGVAALFTKQFFTAARDRLSPGGIICQWAHTYDISDGDLRSIAATFSSVFPFGTMWLVGESDILFVASTGPLDPYFANLDGAWRRPGVAADMKKVSAIEPFALWSAYVGGPQELRDFGEGAAIQSDDRMALEFSGPRSLFTSSANGNAAHLLRLLKAHDAPPSIRHARATATPAEWRNRGLMLEAAHEYASAYASYRHAFAIEPTDQVALEGLVHTAIAADREAETLTLFTSFLETSSQSRDVWIALSKLLAASGSISEAIDAAQTACAIEPVEPAALEQLASIFADLSNATELEPVVLRLAQIAPAGAHTLYFEAALRFIRSQFAEALDLLRQTVALDPSYAAAENMIGAIDAISGDFQPARDAFQAALRLNPQDSTVYSNLGLLELAAGNPDAAVAHFAEALSIDPRSETARRGLAEAKEPDRSALGTSERR